MITVGREIENAIQSLISISEEFANLQSKFDIANRDLNMLDTLFSVSRYIGSNTEPFVVMSVLEDSIKGVFGASYCHVIFEPQKTHMSISKELYEFLDYELLKDHVKEVMVIENLEESQLTTLKTGNLLLIPLRVGEDLFGFLACYWQIPMVLSHSSLVFLQIISTQVSMYLKSAHLVNEFKALAILDPLTGIYNRSYLSNIETTTSPVFGESIIMFDIDRFKLINDSKGHQFGDEVLRKFAKILTVCAEQHSGVAFKYGGEEFVIKCEGGESVAIEITQAVRDSFNKETGYTVSAGISTLGDSCMVSSYQFLIGQADDALYVSKQCGRDRYTCSTPDIQILKQAGKALSQLVSKSFRQMSPTALFRLKLAKSNIMTPEQFDKAVEDLSAVARLYDQVFVTPSLDCLLIVSGSVDTDEFVVRAFKHLQQYLPNLSYEIHCLESVFKEVVVHSSRVSELSQIMASELDFSAQDINQLRLACEWHDVGKLCTDPSIYMKKGRLTDEEYAVIKMHSWLSYSIADSHPLLNKFADWVLYHHEDFNGKGYYGLTGDEIPLAAQIISLVDKFDALTENRCYRPAYTWEQALLILNQEAPKFSKPLFQRFEKMIVHMMTDGSSAVRQESFSIS